MGRFPLRAAINRYLERRKLMVKESTWNNERRYLFHMADVFEPTRGKRRLVTTNPQKMGPDEIKAIVKWMQEPESHQAGSKPPREKALDLDTQVRYLDKMDAVLKMNGNDIIQRMREEGYRLPRRAGPKPIRVLTKADLEIIQEVAERIGSATGEPEGWRRAKAQFLMSAYVATGLRPSELRLAHLEDLNIRNWTLYVRSPKGGGRYAEGRVVPVLPPYQQTFLDFLKARDENLRYHGRKEATYLVPHIQGGKDAPYSANHFGELKREVEKEAGIAFKLKDFRSTFASLSVEMDPNSLNDVSVVLGHSNIKTTQRSYAQMSASGAGARLKTLWNPAPTKEDPSPALPEEVKELLDRLGITSIEELEALLPQKSIPAKKGVIDSEKWLPGYV